MPASGTLEVLGAALAGSGCFAGGAEGASGACGGAAGVAGTGAAMLIVTHNLAEGLAVATHAAIMRDGRFARHDDRAAIDPAVYAAQYREIIAA